MTTRRTPRSAASALLVPALLVAATAFAGATPALTENHCAPAGNLRGDAKRGAALHKERCAECHGLDGKAQVIILHMDTPPHDQTDAEYMKKLPDQFLYLAVCRGGEAVGRSVVMPPWGDLLSDQDIRDLVAWIRTFSGT
jgi:mono/diheme cytochrome c family protein